MKDQIVQIIHERGSLKLFGRQGQYEAEAPDVFFLRAPDAERLPHSWRDRVIGREGDFVRVRWPESGARSSRSARLMYFNDAVFKPRGLEPLEADVSPVTRYIVEHPGLELATDWRYMMFDIETEKVRDWDAPWRSRILAFSWRNHEGRQGHVRLSALTDAAERELLSTFARLASKVDILLAWNGERFDFPVIKSRMIERNVDFDPSVVHWIDHLVLFKKYFVRSEDGGVTSSFALDKIGEALLGQRKVPLEQRARAAGWDGTGDLFLWTYSHAPELMREYNNQDVELMAALELKTSFIALHFSICKLCRVLPTQRSIHATTLIDGCMFQRGFEMKYHFPTKWQLTEEQKMSHERARGALVLHAQVGLHESVAVLDYARMYPSIIKAFNMSLETVDPTGDLAVPETDERGQLTGNTVARFRQSPVGHLPAALGAILDARKRYSKRQTEVEIGSPEFYDLGRLSQACKVTANAFYGVVLSIMSRYYRREMGESVTSMGRLLLASTVRTAEGRGHRLIFGDTDSIAINATCEQAQDLKREINEEVIPRILKRAGIAGGKSDVQTDYEKRYARIIVTASKRYAGRYAIYKGKPASPDTPIDVRGLEIVRSDVCRAARVLQRSVIERILDDGVEWSELRATLLEARKRFWLEGAPISELVLSKGLTQPIDAYKTKPFQVKVAEKMRDQGMEVDVGSKIPFVFVDSGAVHPSEVDDIGDVDRVVYWNKYIYPPTERVLESAYPDRKWEELRLNPRTAIKGQMELTLDDELSIAPAAPPSPAPRPVRRVRRVEPAAVERPIRRVRAVLTLMMRDTITEEAAVRRAARLRAVLEAHPGPNVVRFTVALRGLQTEVDLSTNVRVAAPETSPTFAAALRAMGVQWSRAPTSAAP